MTMAFHRKLKEPVSRELLHETAVVRVIEAMKRDLVSAISLHEMADIACFSPFHFNRIFKEVTGIPPNQFLYALRLEQAKRLLISTSLSVTDICFEVGYNSLGSFINRFTDLVGLSPNAFRRMAFEFSDFRLGMIRDAITVRMDRASSGAALSGKIQVSPEFDGIVFVGLFRRAIPESQPVSCTLLPGTGDFKLSSAERGPHFVFAAGVPWSGCALELFTLDGLPRGRSRKISVGTGQEAGAPTIRLRQAEIVHPPILAAILVMVLRQFADPEIALANA